MNATVFATLLIFMRDELGIVIDVMLLTKKRGLAGILS